MPVPDGVDDTQREVLDRIARGQLYNETEAAFLSPQRRADLIFEYNRTLPSDWTRRGELLKSILGSVGERVVLPGVRIGYGSVIGAGSVVTRDVPPMSVAVGSPARVIRSITDADLLSRVAPRPYE